MLLRAHERGGGGCVAVLACEVQHRRMTVLLVIGGLLTLLAVACWWEARSGKPGWGQHLAGGQVPTPRSAATSAKAGVAGTVALGTFLGMDGGGDG